MCCTACRCAQRGTRQFLHTPGRSSRPARDASASLQPRLSPRHRPIGRLLGRSDIGRKDTQHRPIGSTLTAIGSPRVAATIGGNRTVVAHGGDGRRGATTLRLTQVPTGPRWPPGLDPNRADRRPCVDANRPGPDGAALQALSMPDRRRVSVDNWWTQPRRNGARSGTEPVWL